MHTSSENNIDTDAKIFISKTEKKTFIIFDLQWNIREVKQFLFKAINKICNPNYQKSQLFQIMDYFKGGF